ncbi:hypothetical protein AVEN_8352-1 [Araneus ventricosus]|uniref:Uncharacterized protein n=1 Tax=Araneus ventricosus TaxID=182803 RepID=A0A4Y2QH42_ARAVE|nr:hypothetical protein AVEN_8352-1 [Araneus ventricosus]
MEGIFSSSLACRFDVTGSKESSQETSNYTQTRPNVNCESFCARRKTNRVCLSFHECRPRFALFPIVGTGRIDVACGLVSASVVPRVMAVNRSHVKGGGAGRRRLCIRSLERCQEIGQATRSFQGASVRNSTDHSPHIRTSKDSWFAKLQAVRTRINSLNPARVRIPVPQKLNSIFVHENRMKSFLSLHKFKEDDNPSLRDQLSTRKGTTFLP